jgi:hypothetical protein
LKTPGIYVLGFSLITSGFAGYSIYAIFNYLKNVLKIPLNSSFILLIFSLNNMIILPNLKISSTEQFIMLSAFTLLLFIFIYSIYANRLGIKQMVSMLTFNRIKGLFKGGFCVSVYKLLLISLTIKYLFYLPVLIPPEIVIGKGCTQHIQPLYRLHIRHLHTNNYKVTKMEYLREWIIEK